MKIVLNIKELLEEGKINQAEYEKLLSLSKNQTGSLALNLLFGFGIIMVCIGVITLTQTASAALITGLLTFLIGLFIQFKGCLLYTSPSPRDGLLSRMPSSA